MLALFILAIVSFVQSAHWAVLVAGSKDFSNYRHQSDICRTYEILTKNGFNPDNIITFMYDDIANHRSNPFPGKIYNVPDGPDVYIGSDKIDYKGADCTAAKFYAVLLGDKAKAGGKVLESTEDDNVFIFYNDHGSSGLICFPVGPYAYADEMSKVMTQMYQKKMYKNLVFYVEACYSGSMFKKYLTDQTNVFALTAAHESESSWAEYCGIAKYKTCLSNEYSQRWMEHSTANDLSKITMGEQADHTREATKRSHVMSYGDLSIRDHKVINYQGGYDAEVDRVMKVVKPSYIRPPTAGETPQWKTVPQRQAHLTYLKTAAEADMFGSEALEYHQELAQKKIEENRRDILQSFWSMGDVETSTIEIAHDMPLYRRAIEAFEDILGRMNEFSIWDTTLLLTRAINENKLTPSTFNAYVAKLRTMA